MEYKSLGDSAAQKTLRAKKLLTVFIINLRKFV